MLEQLPDWMPFGCLITGKIVRKPMFTRLFEGLLTAALAGGFSLVVGVKILQADFLNEKDRLDRHLVRYEAQIGKRDREIQEAKTDAHRVNDEIIRRLESIENCVRIRTCTK